MRADSSRPEHGTDGANQRPTRTGDPGRFAQSGASSKNPQPDDSSASGMQGHGFSALGPSEIGAGAMGGPNGWQGPVGPGGFAAGQGFHGQDPALPPLSPQPGQVNQPPGPIGSLPPPPGGGTGSGGQPPPPPPGSGQQPPPH